MTALRLLADDLTGALDSAAEFVALTGPVPVFWHGAIPSVLPPNAALDSGSREMDAGSAVATVHHLAPHIATGAIAFKKIDSLLRGHTIAELAACMRGEGWRYCVLAPAFPFHGRVTRGGRQYVRDAAGQWTAAGNDLIAALTAAGVDARPGYSDVDPQPGISVFDAETDDDLAAIVAVGRRCPHPVLWAGTGGLAKALAGQEPPAMPPPRRPVLGLVGSDHDVTMAQLGDCAPHWMTLPDGGPDSAARVARAMAETGSALASIGIRPGTSRPVAAERIARQLGALIGALPPPGTLLVAGGETLRAICLALGATSLDVRGRIVPGMPWSVMVGGRWDGVTVISKSGAFGHPGLLRELLAIERTAP